MTGHVRVTVSSIEGEVRAPPSKSYTHRAFIASLIASGTSKVINPLDSSDTRATFSMLASLGARVEWESNVVEIESRGPQWASPSINCRESGTTLRLGIGVASLLGQPVLLYGEGRLHKRPVKPLLQALAGLGASYVDSGGYPPVAVRGPITPGHTIVDAWESSQYVSSLMLAASRYDSETVIHVKNPTSRGYIDVTVKVIKAYGGNVERTGYREFRVRGPLAPREYIVPGDWSSGASILAVASAANGRIRITGLGYPDPQPDSRIVDVLRGMGVGVSIGDGWVEVDGAPRNGIRIDLEESPDLAPIVAALAAIACGDSYICRVSRLRFKESDRVEAILGLLRDAGVEAEYNGGCIRVKGSCGNLKPRVLDSRGDHRIAMAAAVLVAGSRDGVVRGWRAVGKSYPGFWSDLRRLGVNVDVQG